MNMKTIETALDGLLREYVVLRDRKDAERQVEGISFSTSIAPRPERRGIPTRDDLLIEAIAENPIFGAVRLAIRHCGAMLDKAGGFDLMQDVCERVADLDQTKRSTRQSILNSAWDGIGGWAA